MVRNVVFDVGNVLVRWEPQDVVAKVFPEELFPYDLTRKLVKSQTWYDLNLGKLTEHEAIQAYNRELNIPLERLEQLMQALKEALLPLDGSFELLDRLVSAEVPTYCITDNVHEIVSFLKAKYDFFDKFKGVVVSAEVGILKPDERIYQHLLTQYDLVPHESVFLDDRKANVEGAIQVGMKGIHFTDALSCEQKLKELNLEF